MSHFFSLVIVSRAVLQWLLIFADYWPITEFPAILKSEMQDTSFFWVTIVLGEPQLTKNWKVAQFVGKSNPKKKSATRVKK